MKSFFKTLRKIFPNQEQDNIQKIEQLKQMVKNGQNMGKRRLILDPEKIFFKTMNILEPH